MNGIQKEKIWVVQYIDDRIIMGIFEEMVTDILVKLKNIIIIKQMPVQQGQIDLMITIPIHVKEYVTLCLNSLIIYYGEASEQGIKLYHDNIKAYKTRIGKIKPVTDSKIIVDISKKTLKS